MAAVIFGLGFVIGPALDQIHVLTKTLSYPVKTLFGQPLWVHPQFAVASLVMILPFWSLRPVFGGKELTPAPFAEVASTFIRFVTMYLLSGLLNDYEFLLTAWFAIAFGLSMVRKREQAPVWIHAVTCAVGGTAWEATLCAAGAFSYDVPHSLFTVPAWLPFLYLHAGYWLRTVARYLPAPTRA